MHIIILQFQSESKFES